MKLKIVVLLLVFLGVNGFSQEYNPQDHYTKKEVQIKMRDGVHLHTTIYSPKDTSKKYPILLQRTPYSCRHCAQAQHPIYA